jgi:hypothetical protein
MKKMETKKAGMKMANKMSKGEMMMGGKKATSMKKAGKMMYGKKK